MSIPVFIYIAMGLVTAAIFLGKTERQAFTLLNWIQFLVQVACISLLWPLVLFAEKLGVWLRSSGGSDGG